MVDCPLYGKDDTHGIVGVVEHDDERVRVYIRDGENVSEHLEYVYPVIFTTDSGLELARAEIPAARANVVSLNGTNEYRNLLVFNSIGTFRRARRMFYRQGAAREFFAYASVADQYLMQTGRTMFKGMAPNSIRRMQLDIEAYAPGRFPQPDRDPVIIISLMDNAGWKRVLFIPPPGGRINDGPAHWERCEDERDMLERLVKYIHRRDPDVIEGHNIFSFDLPYLQARAEAHEVNFAIGRDNKAPRTYKSEKKFAERDVEYTNFLVGGRSVIDTMFLAIDWDVYKRSLPGYGLKDIARHIGAATDDRTYIAGDDIAGVWETHPEKLLDYALDDVIETKALSDRFGASVFYLTQMMPIRYQQVHLRGKAYVIQSLFVREYLRKRTALPLPEDAAQKHGGYTDIFQRGIFDDLLYADVSSLYPSIMLQYNVEPPKDELRVFRYLLERLTELRLDTKAEMKTCGPDRKEELDARQSAYKIIINSFYGGLGAGSKWLFSCVEEADRVAKTGQALLKRMIQLVELAGGDVVECDTDGVIFVAPEGIDAAGPEGAAFVRDISQRMPEGINVDLEGYFPRMLSLKKKNYALMDTSGNITIKGSALKSRGIEPFLISYMSDVIAALMDRDIRRVGEIHEAAKRGVVLQTYRPQELAKTATLKVSIEEYKRKVADGGNRAAQYEIAVRMRDLGHDIGKGSRISWIIAGERSPSRVRAYVDGVPLQLFERGTANVAYYLRRIQDTAGRFAAFFDAADFNIVFDKTPPKFTADMFGHERNLRHITTKNTRLR